MPAVAALSAGASLVPSPTITTLCPLCINSFTASTFCCGSRSPRASVMPKALASPETLAW